MYEIITLILLLLFSYKITLYIYKLLTFDVSELKNFIKKNKNTKFIICGYGHTSWKDVPFYIISGMKIGNIKCLAKKEYKILYPAFTHKYIHFIEKNTSKTIFNTNLTLLIEGSREYKEKIKSGFIYLAKNNDAKILFFINNYKKNKIEISKLTNYNDEDILSNLKELINKIPKNNYSFYPEKCSKIVL